MKLKKNQLYKRIRKITMRRMSVKIKIKTKLVVSKKNLIEERN
jgi:hypothetical protein